VVLPITILSRPWIDGCRFSRAGNGVGFMYVPTKVCFAGLLLLACGDSCILCGRVDRECQTMHVRFRIDMTQSNYPH